MLACYSYPEMSEQKTPSHTTIGFEIQGTKDEALNSELRKIDGVDKWMTRGEIKELPSILWGNELPEKLITGTYNNGRGILVATNRRLIFIDKGMVSLKVEDFSYDKISSIESKTGMVFGSLTIYASGNKEKFEYADKGLLRGFADFLRAKISTQKSQSSPTAASPVENPSLTISVADELEKLAGLRDRGIITDEEFSAQKAKLLA